MAAAVVLLALAAPAAAMAVGGGNCSACKVYHEGSVPKVGGKHLQHQHPTGSTTTKSSGGKKPQVPKKVARVLAGVGTDKGALSGILHDSGLGTVRAGPGSVTAPSALGAAFDLGSGPTMLLAILVASALGFAIFGGVRGWRRRRVSA
jgi:hypothetical protein